MKRIKNKGRKDRILQRIKKRLDNLKRNSEKGRTIQFWGGAPVHDLVLDLDIEYIQGKLDNPVIPQPDNMIFLPVGIYFMIVAPGGQTFYFNPAAAKDNLTSDGRYTKIEFGGKKLQGIEDMLSEDEESITKGLDRIMSDNKIGYTKNCIRLPDLESNHSQVESITGGNNYNIILAINKILVTFDIPEKSQHLKEISFLHNFAYGSGPFWDKVRKNYAQLGVQLLPEEYSFFQGLSPRISIILNPIKGGIKQNRSIFTTTPQEENLITPDSLALRYEFLRSEFEKGDLVLVNTISNCHELATIARWLPAFFAYSQKSVILSPSGSFINTAERLVNPNDGPVCEGIETGRKGYYNIHGDRFYRSGPEMIQDRLIKNCSLLVGNLDELLNLFPQYKHQQSGLDTITREIKRHIGTAKIQTETHLGDLFVTYGSEGSMFITKPSDTDYTKYRINKNSPASLQIKAGGDKILDYIGTRGAGDVTIGTYIALRLLGWSKIHSLFAAMYGSQYFIRTGNFPSVANIITQQLEHTDGGTEEVYRELLTSHQLGGRRKEIGELRTHRTDHSTMLVPVMGSVVNEYLKQYREGRAADTTFQLHLKS